MYLQHPVRFEDTIYCVSGDRLWRSCIAGGMATCLTDALPVISSLLVSGDGRTLYFVCNGDVYTMPSVGGVPQRLTHEGTIDAVIGWTEDVSMAPLLWGIARSACFERTAVTIRPQANEQGPKGQITPWKFGPCAYFSQHHSGRMVLQRHGYGYGSWKRYQGGTAATLWVDEQGDEQFVPLLTSIKHNKISPIWIKERIYFVCDHEGHGHLYSCLPNGKDIQRHTNQDTFYPRQLSRWQDTLIYQSGGFVWTFDTVTQQEQRIDIQIPRGALEDLTERQDPKTYVTSVSPSPKGTYMAMTTRGRLFTLTPHRGPAMQRGIKDGVRYRWALWCADHTLVALVDHGTYETIEHYGVHGEGTPRELHSQQLGWGRLVDAMMHPKEPILIGMNQAHQLVWIHVTQGHCRVIAHSQHGPFLGYNWSPCGQWIVYSAWTQRSGSAIQLIHVAPWLEAASATAFLAATPGVGTPSMDSSVVTSSDAAHSAALSDAHVLNTLSDSSAAATFSSTATTTATATATDPSTDTMVDADPDTLSAHDHPSTQESSCPISSYGTSEPLSTGQTVISPLPVHVVSDARFWNTHPVFDPDGKYLYFLSSRDLKPQWDDLGLSMGCYDVVRPYVCVLQSDAESPFVAPLWPDKQDSSGGDSPKENAALSSVAPGASLALADGERADGGRADTSNTSDDPHTPNTPSTSDTPSATNGLDESCASTHTARANQAASSGSQESASVAPSAVPPQTRIDLEGLDARIQAFPLPPKAYHGLWALSDALWYGVKNDDGHYDVLSYDFKGLKEEPMVSDVTHMGWSLDREWMTYRTANHKLRTVRTNAKPDDAPDSSYHQGGWLDWSRVPLVITPQKEWQHMFDEAWRLQKEMFWMPHMGDVDWDAMYRRYQPCVQRLTALSELHSVISDLQGELGTSHAYLMPPKPMQHPWDMAGSIGCSWSYCPTKKAYRIHHLYEGDDRHPVPLRRPGVNVRQGDWVHSMAGQTLSCDVSPDRVLSSYIGQALTMTVSDGQDSQKPPRTVMVFPVPKSRESRWVYRQWVNQCRRFVHEHTQGRVGYIHIPDMQEEGMREFLLGYTQEFDKEGLIVDVRYNGGGNLSYLMLDYLRRQRLGYDQSRHQGMMPYPSHSPKGPMVAVANEYTGSDGDIFSHAFKTLKMGPLIGKRTWGGVVGIWTRYDLMDGTVTSQPEYSFWFQDVGWSIENQGVTPTIDIDITPMDSAHNRDPQLLCAIAQVESLIEQDRQRQSLLYPTPGSEPSLASGWTLTP